MHGVSRVGVSCDKVGSEEEPGAGSLELDDLKHSPSLQNLSVI